MVDNTYDGDSMGNTIRGTYVHVIDVSSGAIRRLTYPYPELFPFWSKYWPRFDTDPEWSPDAGTIAFSRRTFTHSGGAGVATMDLLAPYVREEGSSYWGPPVVVMKEPNRGCSAGRSNPSYSPDGTEIAYEVYGCGTYPAVHVSSVSTHQGEYRVGQGVGETIHPEWSPDGTSLLVGSYTVQGPRIYYDHQPGSLHIVPANAGPGNTRVLADAALGDPQAEDRASWAPDGAFFVSAGLRFEPNGIGDLGPTAAWNDADVQCAPGSCLTLVTIIKEVTGAGESPAVFEYRGSVRASVIHTANPFAPPGSYSTRAKVRVPGAVVITEEAHPSWELSDISCNEPHTTDVAARQVELTIAEGEEAVCTFTSQPITNQAVVRVVKTFDGPGGVYPTEFEYFGALDGTLTATSHTQSDALVRSVQPGTASVSEVVHPHWLLSSIECNRPFSRSIEDRQVSVEVQAGDVATCEFTSVPRLSQCATSAEQFRYGVHARTLRNGFDHQVFQYFLQLGFCSNGNSVTSLHIEDPEGFVVLPTWYYALSSVFVDYKFDGHLRAAPAVTALNDGSVVVQSGGRFQMCYGLPLPFAKALKAIGRAASSLPWKKLPWGKLPDSLRTRITDGAIGRLLDKIPALPDWARTAIEKAVDAAIAKGLDSLSSGNPFEYCRNVWTPELGIRLYPDGTSENIVYSDGIPAAEGGFYAHDGSGLPDGKLTPDRTVDAPSSSKYVAPLAAVPTITDATVDHRWLSVYWSHPLDAAIIPDPASFAITVDGGPPVAPTSVDVSPHRVDLRLAQPVTSGASVELDYSPPATSPLTGVDGLVVRAFTDHSISNTTPAAEAVAPVLEDVIAGGNVVALSYDEWLDDAALPDVMDFTVELEEWDPYAEELVRRSLFVEEVTVGLNLVSLQLGEEIAEGATVKVTYVPGASSVQDLFGNLASDFAALPAANYSDTTEPDTTSTNVPPARVASASVDISFTSNETGVVFECSLDNDVAEPCESPYIHRDLERGDHILRVTAIDAAGNVDQTPAEVSWMVACITAPFSDVAGAHPFCAEIEWMKDRGISTGFSDGTYRPGDNVTRQAMSAFMARFARARLFDCTTGPFTDVPQSHPFCKEITWMKTSGMSTGFSDGTYRPGANVTRQAMSAFMARVVGADPESCVEAPFSDVPIDHPFCKEIRWMKDNGISTGFSDGTYRPSANVTRQAMSAFMYRLSNY